MGIRSIHAIIKKMEEKFYLEPIFEHEESSCYLNGDHLTKKEQVYHLDRVSFGTNNMFLVIVPDSEPRDDIDERQIDW